MTKTGIIQVKQGIGDVMWHLPFISAIAAVSPGGAVTFLTLPSSHGRELLEGERCVAETLYFEHLGSEWQRGMNQVRLIALLRRCAFRSVWILDRTIRPALAAAIAGIPERIGLGLGPQRLFITNPGIDRRHRHDYPIEQLRLLLTVMQIPLASTESDLQLPAALIAAIGNRFRALARPWIVIGMGGSRPTKDWPVEHWITFLSNLRARTAGTILFVGGAANLSRTRALIEQTAGAPAVNATDLSVAEDAALMQHADLFIGIDSGPMNLAAAAGIPTFAMFGSTPVLTYSKFIHAIEPDDGCRFGNDGMARISPAQVLARVEPYLAVRQTAT